MKAPEPRITRKDYPHFLSMPTRWMDNDVYGHVNNVIYYSFFDTLINQYLVSAGGLDYHSGPVIGIAVETMCQFKRELTYPELVEGGLRVGKLGNSSVRYEIGLFGAGHETPAAVGYFVHVFVERASRKPTPIPPRIRAALEKLSLNGR